MGKKDTVLKKNRNNLYLLGIIVLLIIVIGILIIPKKEVKASSEVKSNIISETLLQNSKYTVVKDEKGVLTFPVSAFDDSVKYFEYNGVKFFILKSNDGTIRAAFDACDVCYRSKRGYKQVGDFMQCNNCGQTFPEDQINVVLGGCNPSPLNREIVGDNLIIKTSDVLDGQRFF